MSPRNPQTPLRDAIESREMIQVGEWQLVKREVLEWLQPGISGEMKNVPASTVDSHRNRWLHEDGRTVMDVSEHTEGHFWGRVKINGGDGSAGGITCGVGTHSDEPEDVVAWAYEYMTTHPSEEDLRSLYE
jgi:hypothetical protein